MTVLVNGSSNIINEKFIVEKYTNKSITGKQSTANRSWIAVWFVVLSILFFETRGTSNRVDNLILNGGEDEDGAEVFVDGKSIGRLSTRTPVKTGFDGSVLLTHIESGKHLLEVKKVNYKTFSKPIDVELEQYIGVDLVQPKE